MQKVQRVGMVGCITYRIPLCNYTFVSDFLGNLMVRRRSLGSTTSPLCARKRGCRKHFQNPPGVGTRRPSGLRGYGQTLKLTDLDNICLIENGSKVSSPDSAVRTIPDWFPGPFPVSRRRGLWRVSNKSSLGQNQVFEN